MSAPRLDRSSAARRALVAVAPAPPVDAAAAPQDAAWQAVETFRGNLARSARSPRSSCRPICRKGSRPARRSRVGWPAPSRCLRWDYDEPYPKSFILCGDVIHYWNPGETEGHVDEIDAEREPGLDLLLVGVDELRRRYDASVEAVVEERGDHVAPDHQERLRHRSDARARSEARSPGGAALSRSRRQPHRVPISGYQPGVTSGAFNSPKDVTWLDEY